MIAGCQLFAALDAKFGGTGLKRYRVLATLGLLALFLLASAAAFSPAPAMGSDAAGFGPVSHRETALGDTGQRLVIQNADPAASNTSRSSQSSAQGIIPQSIPPNLLGGYGKCIASVHSISARGIGFHLRLRAPPVFLLS